MKNNQNNTERPLIEILKELGMKILSYNKNKLFLKLFLTMNIISVILLVLAFLNSISLIFTKDFAAFDSMINVLRYIENIRWLAWSGLILFILHLVHHHKDIVKANAVIVCLGNIGVVIYVYFMNSTPVFTQISAITNTLKFMPLVLLVVYLYGLIVTYNNLFINND